VSYSAPGPPLYAHTPPYYVAVGSAARPVAKLLARHDGMQQKLLISLASAIARDDAVITRSGPELVEIAAAGVTKASTLEFVCKARGLGSGDVLAFGDMVNDVSMLTWAGRGVVVAGAHPDLLAIADEVTASAADDGVAVYLENLLGIEPPA